MSGSIDRKKNQKGSLKEKILQIYDKLFQPQLNRLLVQCLHTAQHEKRRIRVANAIQTMDALISGIYRCKLPPDAAEDASELLLGLDQTKEFMSHYTELCMDMFREDRPERLRSMMINSMHTLATASSNFRTSPFTLGLLNAHIFDLLRLILINTQLRYHHGSGACKLLGLLTQFGTAESGEHFTEELCLTEDELLLNFGTLFVGDMASNVSLRPCDSLLICMYAITKSGVHFSTILSYSNAHYDHGNSFDSLSITESLRGLAPMHQKRSSFPEDDGHDSDSTATPSLSESMTESLGRSRLPPNGSYRGGPYESFDEGGDCRPDLEVTTTAAFGLGAPTPESTTNNTAVEETNGSASSVALEPRNLLADLLEYCSIVMQDVKTPESLNSCHLCLIIVLCITQNPMACSILHDPHITFKVSIHRRRPRHRKADPVICGNYSSRPIAVAILSLVVEFMRGHLMKKLPHRLYSIACSLCHNLLCYQSKHKIRLDFDWKQLWSALLSMLQFILNLDHDALPLVHGLSLIKQILDILNFCILRGDSFLLAADVYDDLYYELIRMRGLIEHVYEHCLSHSTGSNVEVKPLAANVVQNMGNIRSIVNHFNAKIAAFSTTNSLASLTESQVLSVVRENYDSLTLRVYDDLDLPTMYKEPADEALFDTLVDTVLRQTRKDCLDNSLQMQSFFHELSAIH